MSSDDSSTSAPDGEAQPEVVLTVRGVPACPGAVRPELDVELITALQELEKFFYDMRKDVGVPNGVWDETTAVLRYLAYLSVLIDIWLSDIALSALHSIDLAILMKLRVLVEYVVRAQYVDSHTDYALYMMTVGEASSVVRKLEESGSDEDIVGRAKAELAERRRRFSSVANLKQRTLLEMMREFGTGDDYVWLYGAPSALMHGDAEGIRQLFETSDSGQEKITIKLEPAHVNAMMVDVGGNVLMFCDVFIRRFRPTDTDIIGRKAILERKFKTLLIRHPLGRDVKVLEDIGVEIGGPLFPDLVVTLKNAEFRLVANGSKWEGISGWIPPNFPFVAQFNVETEKDSYLGLATLFADGAARIFDAHRYRRVDDRMLSQTIRNGMWATEA